MTTTTFILTALVIAITAIVYSVDLTKEGMLLNGWYKLLFKLFAKHPYIFNPIIDCFKCVAGQMALWYYLIVYWSDYRPFEHLALISVSIFLSIILHKIHQWDNY